MSLLYLDPLRRHSRHKRRTSRAWWFYALAMLIGWSFVAYYAFSIMLGRIP